METLDLILAVLNVPLIAGAIGGAIRAMYHKEDWRQASSGILTGAFTAHYFSLFAGQWFDGFANWTLVDPAAGRAAGAFAIGTMGTWALQWFWDFMQRRLAVKKES